MTKNRRAVFLVAWCSMFMVITGCRETITTGSYTEIRGKTMGTTYTVKYNSFDNEVAKDSIDVLLQAINDAVSPYISTSLISQFNRKGFVKLPVDEDGRPVHRTDSYFMSNVLEALHIFDISDGAFDPTVGPLVNLWGFGWEGRKPEFPDSSVIDSILQYVGMQYVEVARNGDTVEVRRTRDGVTLDFNAIAKGFGVDMIAKFLEEQNITDYYVEIGGELKVAGSSPSGGHWILGINTPLPEASPTDVFTKVGLGSRAMATSGNYRNFYVLNGVKAWHSINPASGYPEQNNLLSATIVYQDCMTADALATACMIKGIDGAVEFIEGIEGAEAFFIQASDDGTMSTRQTGGFANYLLTE